MVPVESQCSAGLLALCCNVRHAINARLVPLPYTGSLVLTPPSATIVCPVTFPPAAEARNKIVLAISAGAPGLDATFYSVEELDDARRFCRYTNIAGMPVSHYAGMLEVKPKDGGCIVDWRVQFLANHQSDRAVKSLVSTLLKTGLESLKSRFGVAA